MNIKVENAERMPDAQTCEVFEVSSSPARNSDALSVAPGYVTPAVSGFAAPKVPPSQEGLAARLAGLPHPKLNGMRMKQMLKH